MIYRIKTEWSGYSRGESVYEVEAANEEDARCDYWHGVISENTVRDDREEEVVSIEAIQ